jgi:hypothetical protein
MADHAALSTCQPTLQKSARTGTMRFLGERRDRASKRFQRVQRLVLVASVIVATFVARQLVVGEPIAGALPAIVLLAVMFASYLTSFGR